MHLRRHVSILVTACLVGILAIAGPDKAMAISSYLVYAGQGAPGKTGAGDPSSDLDAKVFMGNLNTKPTVWTSNLLKSSTAGALPYHDDLTNYPDNTRQSRLLYYSGHGFHDGFIPFFQNYGVNESSVWKPVDGVWKYDLLRFDGSWNHVNNNDTGYAYWWPNDAPTAYHGFVGANTLKQADWAVGAHMISGTASASRWNDNIEHVFFAACSLLNDQNQGVNGAYRSTWSSAATGWGRAMLGTPRRVNQVCGYREGAPGDTVDGSVVNEYFYRCALGDDITSAWIAANLEYSAFSYAVIEHATASGDHMPGWGPGDQASLTSTDLTYWYFSALSPKPLSVSAAPTVLDRLEAWLASLLMPQDVAMASPGPVSLPSISVTPETWDEDAVAHAILGDEVAPRVTSGSSQLTSAPASSPRLYQSPKGSVSFFESGAISADLGEFEATPCSLDASEAVRLATEYAAQFGGVPGDALPCSVGAVMYKSLNVALDDFVAPTVAAYEVSWGRQVDGVPVSGPGGDSIRVRVTGDGHVQGFFRLWREISSRSQDHIQLRNDPGVELAARGRLPGIPDEAGLESVQPVYFAPSFRDNAVSLKPAWKASFDEGSNRWFDADGQAELPAAAPYLKAMGGTP